MSSIVHVFVAEVIFPKYPFLSIEAPEAKRTFL